MAAQSRPPILITRPEPQATRFARKLRGLDWVGKVHVAPLMTPEILKVSLPQRPFKAVVLTSETGALAAGLLAANLPRAAWCVGDRTARVARAKGFLARSAKGDSLALAQAIIASGQAGPLLLLQGRETAGHLGETLNSAGIETVSVTIYAQNLQPLTAAAERLIRGDGPVILPVLSPRSAQLLVQAWQDSGARAQPWPVALSPAVARALQAFGPDRVTIAETSDGDSLLAAMKDLMRRAPWA
jgi:uroporphyrinogen-III synthase